MISLGEAEELWNNVIYLLRDGIVWDMHVFVVLTIGCAFISFVFLMVSNEI